MNIFATLFLACNTVALLTLPRLWASLPILLGACYMTPGQGIQVGPFHFTVLRLLLLVGFLRAFIRQERLSGGLQPLDSILLLWGVWLVGTSAFHKAPIEALVFRLGVLYNYFGFYFLLRIYCNSDYHVAHLVKLTAILLVPVALEMIYEKFSGRNLFAAFGGVPENVMVRDDKFRAQGPFGHPILAGTVGAMCLPLMVGIWPNHRRHAAVGIGACLAMAFASTSSGPLMSLAFSLLAIGLWRFRRFTRLLRIWAVCAYVLLDIVMKDPAYFIIARIDLTGSSTGYHRAALIQSAIKHIDEWWIVGTDFTRHWMPYGVSFSEDHCDITNHYLYYGVWGGLPLVLLFVWQLWTGFRYVGETLRILKLRPLGERFLVWSLGATLLSHAITCLSVAYFDQSVLFLYMTLAAIGSLRATAVCVAHTSLPKALPDPLVCLHRSLNASQP